MASSGGVQSRRSTRGIQNQPSGTSSYPGHGKRASTVTPHRHDPGRVSGATAEDNDWTDGNYGSDHGGQSKRPISPYEYRDDTLDILNSRIGVYGWRKRCLYLFVTCMAAVLILNLALLVWITRIMNFNLDGMGNLRIHSDRITVQGRSEFARGLFTQSVTSERNEALRLLSTSGVNITAGQAYMLLGGQSIEAQANQLEIRDSNGSTYFSINPSRLSTSVDSIVLNGSRGASFQEFIQTREVRAEAGRPLQLVSPSGSLTLRGGSGLHLAASGSGISMTSPSSILLDAGTGNLTLNSSNLILPQLPIFPPVSGDLGQPSLNVYEVCACRSGKLFLAPTTASNPCQAAGVLC